MAEPIKFKATVCRVKTMADGGLRFEFDTSEDVIMQMAMLAECKRAGIVLDITCLPIEHLTELDNDDAKQADERPEKRTSKVGRRRS